MREKTRAVEAIYDRRPVWAKGSISRSDARFLYDRVLQATDEAIVEIGTASGVSTAVLCSAVGRRSTSYTVASYDISPTYYADRRRRTGAAAKELLSAEQLAHVEFRNPATALDVAGDYSEDSLGFVFIDAAHKHPWPSLDLLAVLTSLRPGAEVVFHDINLPLINSDWQAWGVKYLFDELEVEKHTDPENEMPNIGSIIVPEDKESIRQQALATIAARDYEVEVPQQTLGALLS
jgi:predicted O-methyltransferase YrrM